MRKRVIVCGFGFMGQNHAANILHSDTLELAAVVDSTPKSVLKPVTGNIAAGAFDWEKLSDTPFFASLSAALAACPADAVLIAAPTDAHLPLALEAAVKGKHIFVEKPLCFVPEDAKPLKLELAGKDLVFQVGHCVRFAGAYKLLRTLCKEGKFGRLRHLKLYRFTGRPNWGAWRNLEVSLTSATGPLFDLCIHDIDYALSLAGEPDSVKADPTRESDCTFRTVWKYRNDGCSIEIEGGFMMPSPVPFRCGFTAVFDHAAAEYDSRLGEKVVISRDDGGESVDCMMENSVYMDEIAEFAAAMIDGKAVSCGFDDGIRAVTYCHKIKKLLESVRP